MTRLTGLPVRALDVLGEVAEDLVERLLGEVAAEVARGWTARSTPDDLSRVTDLWQTRVDEELYRMLGGALRAGSDAVAPVLVPDNDPAALAAGVANLSSCALRVRVADPRVDISKNVASTMRNDPYPFPPPATAANFRAYYRWEDEVEQATSRHRNTFVFGSGHVHDVRQEIYDFVSLYTGGYENIPTLRHEMRGGKWSWMRSAIEHGPEHDGVLYRTIPLDEGTIGIDATKIRPGSLIDHRLFSSYTRVPPVFAEDLYAVEEAPNLFIRLYGARGLSVEKISNSPAELEWLVGGHARVRSVQHVPRSYGGELIHDLEVIADHVPAHLTAAADDPPYVFPVPDKTKPLTGAPGPRPADMPAPELEPHEPPTREEATGPALTAATFDADAVLRVPCVDNAFAEAYLGTRRNHLVGVGDELWDDMRDELLEGYRRGESIPELQDRLVRAHRLTVPRARTIARTEVIGAADVGSLLQVRATGLPALKRWVATNDSRTRPHHRAAHNQEVDLDDKFRVGGTFLDGPHDPLGPASEVVNCRCALSYEVDLAESTFADLIEPVDTAFEQPSFTRAWADELYTEGLFHEGFIIAEHVAASHAGETATISGLPPSPPPPAITAAADDSAGRGAMVALVPDDVDDLALGEDAPGREAPETLHLTLLFLGEDADFDDDERRDLVSALRDLAAKRPVQLGRAFGAAHWNTDTDSPSWNLQVGGDGLAVLRNEVLDTVVRGVLGPGRLPEQHSPWVPHVCLAYTDEDLHDEVTERVGRDLRFASVRVAFGPDVQDLPLGTSDDANAAGVAPSGTLPREAAPAA